MIYARRWLFVLVLLCCGNGAAGTAPLAPEQVPEPLQPWIDWALFDQQDRVCPFLYNKAAHRCSWPGRLQLELDDSGGRFEIDWQIDRADWVTLPGDDRHWPQMVTIDDQPALILERAGHPSVRLAAGTHAVRGRFRWEQMPDSLTVPADTGLVALTIGQRHIAFPSVSSKGRLWLQDTGTGRGQPGVADTLELQVFRRVVDSAPLQVVTQAALDVAGEPRELVLSGMLLDGFIPMQLESPLPARLQPDGELLVQARAGHWPITLTARAPGELNTIALPTLAKPWPPREIWVFEAQPNLRLVRVEGATPVDPSQTNLPSEWKRLPAYRVSGGEAMRLTVVRRGDPQPEPNTLTLQRTLWLDFDGQGFTVNDRINGVMTRGWRLDVQPELKLGRVSLDGRPQLITRAPGSGHEGVEVRRGAIRLTADSRLPRDHNRLHAVGWDQDFQMVSATLHLPPGWRLFSAEGVDTTTNAWLQRWTLLDLFLVLIGALAVWRLWDWCWGLAAMATLVLIWHESGAPRMVWLLILASVALLRVLPPGRLRTLTTWVRGLALLALLMIALPFMIDQVRTGLFPQLEQAQRRVAQGQTTTQTATAADETPAQIGGILSLERKRPPSAPPPEKAARAARSSGSKRYYTSEVIDPQARIQTGPGLPQWRWNRVSLQWNGPVERGQPLQLALVPPTINLLLGLLRVALLVLLALLLSGVIRKNFCKRTKLLATVPWLLLLPGLSLPLNEASANFPDDALLKTLKERLSAPAECLPGCAQIPTLELVLSPSNLHMVLEVHAQAAVAVPLPARADRWVPHRVLVDGSDATGVYRTASGELWLKLTAGRHRVDMQGPLPPRRQLSLPLPLKPHQVQTRGQGWQVTGIRKNGVPADQLQLSKITESTAAGGDKREAMRIPPFFQVERTLQFGLDWRTTTVVRRLSPNDSAIVVKVPILKNESVISPGIQVEKGRVLVNMLPSQSAIEWRSVLEKSDRITLTAPKTTDWMEVWRTDVSPIWHIEPSGVPVVHNPTPKRLRLPEWRPWPGESLTLAISRPRPIAGRTLTIDSSQLTLTPGKRAADATLRLALRSSQGGQHSLTLPERAQLQSVVINDRAQPIRQSGRVVTLPVRPGAQHVEITWREPAAISSLYRTPRVGLGADSINSHLSMHLGDDRWLLFSTGPRLGPAVQFWGVLLLLVPIAWALGRLSLTPLRHWQWFLLLLGLSQIPLAAALVVVGWLFALGLRARDHRTMKNPVFNAIQIGLAVLTLTALMLLFYAVQQGLLGQPDMQIAGNGSSARQLNWYQDHSGADLPRASVISVPLTVYRLLMLAWALWLAYALLDWLRWGWRCFSSHGLWRSVEKKRPAKKAAPRSDTAQ